MLKNRDPGSVDVLKFAYREHLVWPIPPSRSPKWVHRDPSEILLLVESSTFHLRSLQTVELLEKKEAQQISIRRDHSEML